MICHWSPAHPHRPAGSHPICPCTARGGSGAPGSRTRGSGRWCSSGDPAIRLRHSLAGHRRARKDPFEGPSAAPHQWSVHGVRPGPPTCTAQAVKRPPGGQPEASRTRPGRESVVSRLGSRTQDTRIKCPVSTTVSRIHHGRVAQTRCCHRVAAAPSEQSRTASSRFLRKASTLPPPGPAGPPRPRREEPRAQVGE